MLAWLAPPLFALFVWWFATGLILLLVRLPRATHGRSMAGATAVLAAALACLWASREATDAAGAYLGFAAAVAAWGWVEIGFLTGRITGPRRLPCPSDASAWWRAGTAVQAILYHELALLGLGGAIALLAWGAANPIGWWTFLLLWGLRLSAKLNLFLGVRVPNSELLPDHLRYMDSFFARRAINPLFPLSVTLSTAVAVLLALSAAAHSAGSHMAAGLSLLAALAALGVLEHWFMVLPLPSTALWRWYLGPDRPGATARDATVRGALQPVALPPVALPPPPAGRTAAADLRAPSAGGTVVPLPLASLQRRRP